MGIHVRHNKTSRNPHWVQDAGRFFAGRRGWSALSVCQHRVDGGQLFVGERHVLECLRVLPDLLRPGRADEDGGDLGESQRPDQGQLRQGLPAGLSDLVELPNSREQLLVDVGRAEEARVVILRMFRLRETISL